VQSSASMMVDKLMTKYNGLLHAYTTVDANRSGKINRKEFERMLETLNLHNMRREVMDYIFELMDVDGSGGISYKEFARVLTSPDVFSMKAVHRKMTARAPPPRPPDPKKAEQDRRRAASVGLTVQEYLDYYNLKDMPSRKTHEIY